MSEYGDEEIQDDNEEIEEEQELDENISNNQEINIEDFEPINEQDIELDGENFEPSYSIETEIQDINFEISNNVAFENTYEEFEPTYSEKLTFECRIGPEPPRPAFIGAIINDPTLTTAEKIELLEEKQRKLWKNSEISLSEAERISKAIKDAIDELETKNSGFIDTSNSPGTGTTGKHDTSNFKDSQNSIDNKINNQEKFQSEQSEKQDLSGINDEEKELELKEKREKDNYELSNDFEPENEPEYINEPSTDRFEPYDEFESNNNNTFKEDFIPREETEIIEKAPYQYSDIAKNLYKEVNLRNDSFHPYKEVRLNLSQRIGSISELSLIRDLERNGKNVSIPYGDFQRYDLLIEEEGNISRVQVKTAKKKDERFLIYSISKGQLKSYKGEIEYFGVYSQNENKSYLIPIEEINEINNIRTIKLDDSIKQRFEIKYKNFNRKNEEKINDSFINESIHLTQKGKIALSQLGRRDENTIIYDDIMTINNKSQVHSIHELKVVNKGKYKEVNIEEPNQIEIARANVAADLMSNGFIISTPVGNNTNYDFIIEQKYGKEQLKSEKGFYKVKIIDKKLQTIKSDNKNENIDYFGIYNDEKDKSYLISTQVFNTSLRDYENCEIKRSDNVLDVMTNAGRGDATEMRIGAEFMKNGFNVLHPIVGRPPIDLVVKKKNKYYTVEVKTGRTHYEKDSTYLRFDIASQESKNRRRRSYKGKVDFIATVNQDNLKSYIVPVNDLPNNDAKLKLDERKDMRQKHYGTLWAKDYEFSKVDDIVQEFNRIREKEKVIEQINQDIEKLSSKKREIVEYNQILDVLRGSKKIRNIVSINSVFAKHVNQFKKFYPKNKIEYQGVLSVSFRDFLISQSDLKPLINNHLKDKGLYGEGEKKHQIIYDFFDTFYHENKRGPNTLELYRTFLNFKSHELRGKMNIIRKNYPHYYVR